MPNAEEKWELVFAAVAAAVVTVSATAAQLADKVFSNAFAPTMNDALPTAGAAKVTGNRIAFVGSAEEADALAGDNTEVFDLAGETLPPV